ncbi:hypothetical protein SAMN04488057_11286 [Cyclobacterium lianum]|uniref:Uncharacterized protein n=1 Tax=Cyclobacterium lianum TaxID=388280 RepID=A0A1M7PZP5_9BACT|nr:hypothetical protein [Cyclobacterium lianum]SHN23272.1 hypothetical protein SAMN04488057_11286 [Cyclobacterium lianum]
METVKIISIIVAVVVVTICCFVAFMTTLLRESSSKSSPYSFSRCQLWLWTLIICPAFVLNWGFKNTNLPQINQTSLILLGITIGIGLTAGIVSATQKASAKPTTLLKSNSTTTQGFWIDILLDDNGQFSVGRLQNLLFTLIYITIYVSLFFKGRMEYPSFDETAYVLMGISSGGYLIGKGMNK